MVKERYHEIAEFSQEIAHCGRCGFCQEVCPVYQVSAEESGVARGRNVFASELISGGLDLSRRDEAFFSECLLCRACVDICFSGVNSAGGQEKPPSNTRDFSGAQIYLRSPAA